MTFLEKAIEEEKDSSLGLRPQEITTIYCPSSYGFEDGRKCDATDKAKCVECWNREMPNEYPYNVQTDKRSADLVTEVAKQTQEYYYNKGLNDAWEVAKKFFADMKGTELEEIFGADWSFYKIMDMTPQEAIAKLKAYEDSKIVVGDVVTYSGEKGLVLDIKGSKVVVLTDDGCVQEWYECDIEKTGKKVSLEEILEQIGE